jgi:hypothetical protein
MEWREIREAVRSELRGRNLINPRLRLSALDSVDRLVSERYPEFLSNWTVVVEIGKQAVSRELARLKPTGTLNGAEKSVLSQAFVAAANSPPSRITPKNPHETGSQATASKILPVGSTDKDRTNQKTGLCPVIFPSSRLLILGTLPGDESIRLQRYYADAKNQFWRILSLVYGERVGTDYDERLEFLRRSGIALWDVLHGAERVV